MNIKLLKKQLGKGEWEFVEIDIDDEEAVKALKKHNSEINHKVYEEKKLFSQFNVEEIQIRLGYELSDETPDPLQRMIDEEEGNFYDEREEMFDRALSLIGQAKAKLTINQRYVIDQRFDENQKFVTIAKNLNVDESMVRQIYRAAIKKMRKFFLAYPEFIAYFPKLSEL